MKSRFAYQQHLSPLPALGRLLEVVSIGHYTLNGDYVGDRSQGWPAHHFMYTLDGGALAERGGQAMQARAGTWWYFQPQPGHIYRIDPAIGHWEGLWIEFKGEQITELLELAGIDGVHQLHGAAAALPVIEELHRLILRDGDRARLEAASILLRLFAVLGRRHRQDQRDPLDTRIDAMQQWVDDHIHQQIDIAELAAMADLSAFHFLRVFKQRMGLTPGAWILSRRMRRARELLQQGQLNVSEVGRAVGYERVQNFSAAFRRESGMSPRAYAQALMLD